MIVNFLTRVWDPSRAISAAQVSKTERISNKLYAAIMQMCFQLYLVVTTQDNLAPYVHPTTLANMITMYGNVIMNFFVFDKPSSTQIDSRWCIA